MSAPDFLRLTGYALEFGVNIVAPVLFLTWLTWRVAR